MPTFVNSTSPRKQIRRKPEVAETEILEAASDLLEESGFRSLTVGAAMSRTGMQRSAFHNYFAVRNALVMRLLERIETEMMEVARPWLEGADGPRSLGAGLDGIVDVHAGTGTS